MNFVKDTSRRYGLVTAVYNGAKCIVATAESIARQSILPAFWVVVDDGSSDDTLRILEQLKADKPYLEIVQRTRDTKDPFVSKVRALNMGLSLLKGRGVAFIGVLDADITAEPDYFESLLTRMEEDKKLGVAGGNIVPMVEGVRQFRRQSSDFSVAGAVQMFRKECMDELQWKFMPITGGGEDAAMEIVARYHGWKIKTFKDLPVVHNGPVGGSGRRQFKYLFMRGVSTRCLGYHPLFILTRAIKRLRNPPLVFGALTEIAGYACGCFFVREACIDAKAVAYLRREQMMRLHAVCNRLI